MLLEVVHSTLVPEIDSDAQQMLKERGDDVYCNKVLEHAGQILGTLPSQIAAQSGITEPFLRKLVEVEDRMNAKLVERAALFRNCVFSLVAYRDKLLKLRLSPTAYSSSTVCCDWLLAFEALSGVGSDISTLKHLVSHFRFLICPDICFLTLSHSILTNLNRKQFTIEGREKQRADQVSTKNRLVTELASIQQEENDATESQERTSNIQVNSSIQYADICILKTVQNNRQRFKDLSGLSERSMDEST